MDHVAAVQPPRPAASCITVCEPGFRAGTLKPGAAVFMEGQNVDRVYEPVSGIVRLSRTLPDRRRQILGFLFTGEIFTPSGFAFSKDVGATASSRMRVRR